MIKKGSYFLGLTIMATLVSTGFKESEAEDLGKIKGFHLEENETYNYSVTPEAGFSNPLLHFDLPYTGKSFTGFKQAIGVKESQCLYSLVSRFGYMGKYQFGKSALRALGINNADVFLQNPALQERAFRALLSVNKWQLRHEIKRYSGKTVGGVHITESGILAAAHLAGAQSVKNFLRSNGHVRFRDGFGTTLRSYLRNYGGYDTSGIVAKPSVKVSLKG